MPDGTCISIVPFNLEGVRRKKLDEPEEDYDLVCVPVDAEQIAKIETFYEHTKGEGYDWPGMILSKFTPFHVHRINRWYCSQWIAYALRLICVLTLYSYSDLTPQRLYDLLHEYHAS